MDQQAPTQNAQTNLDFLLKASIVAIVRNASGNEEKRYFEAVFPVDATAAEMPWYVLINHLAPGFLNKKLGPQGQGWVKIYEAKTQKIINRRDPADITHIPLRVMTKEQLHAYVVRWELPVKIENYHDLPTAIRFVKLYQDDPKGFEMQHRDYMEGKSRSYPELDKFRRSMSYDVEGLDDEFSKLEQSASEGLKDPKPVGNPFKAAEEAGIEDLSQKDNHADPAGQKKEAEGVEGPLSGQSPAGPNSGTSQPEPTGPETPSANPEPDKDNPFSGV